MSSEKSQEYYEVSELNKKIRSLLDESIGWVKVKGEISSFTPHRTGNLYFTLKDPQGQLDGVVFKNFAKPELLSLGVGDYIYGVGVLTSYVKTGRISFQAFSLSKQGRGSFFDNLQDLKVQLQKEGLFEPQKALTLPPILKKLVVITALQGAAIKDILSIVQDRILGHVELIIIPALMQGEQTASSVIQALDAALKIPDIQAVLISRGGGAYEDLWGFNSEDLVRMIASYPLPVISAIGHEQDYTLCDFVAHTRYATPSAAAYKLFTYKESLLEKLHFFRQKLTTILSNLLSRTEWKLQKTQETLHYLLNRRLEETQFRLDLAHKRLEHLSPLRILKKGYMIITQKNQKEFLPTDSLKLGDVLEIRTLKETFLVEVIQKSAPESR